MKIWINDVDGVVANFAEYILMLSGSPLKLKDITQWDLFALMAPEHKKEAFNILQDPEFWALQPIIPLAQEGIEKILTAGYKLVWCTSPWVSCREWDATRRDWLAKHFGFAKAPVISAPEKSCVSGDVLLDDKVANIVEWTANPRNTDCGILFDAPYNRDNDTLPRLFGWKDIDALLAMLRETEK